MRLLIVAGAFVLLNANCWAASLPANHPIIGTWVIQVPGTRCSETYTFKEDGTKVAKSADEVGESTFVVSATPSPAGYYKLTDTVVASNGKLDCSFQSTPVGDTVSVFLRFEQSANAFSFCPREAPESCIGPFKRISGQASP